MIQLQIFTLETISSNLDWKNKTIKFYPSAEHIHISITHYEGQFNTDIIDSKKYNYLSKFENIKKYWIDNLEQYCQILNIDFNNYILDIDYLLAPILIKNNNIYIGIFAINKKLISFIDNKLYSRNKNKYGFFSTIKPLENVRDINKFNIFNGIINYRNKTGFNNYKYFNQMENKYFNIDNKSVEISTILINARNYISKFEIICEKQFTDYNVFSKSSKSITLPISLPATLSA